jgi:hypothetical protein
MTDVTNKGNNKYYIEGFGDYQANKELTVPEIQSLVQKFQNSNLINEQYDNELTTQDFLQDTGLHESFKRHYKLTKSKDFEGSNEELVDEYKQYMRDYNYNLTQLSYLAVATQYYNENDKQALAHMWNAWEKYEKDDGMGGYVDIGQALLKDPASYLNVASFGTGVAASVAARVTAKTAVKEKIKAYTTSGLIQGAVNGAAYAGIDDVARQNVEMQLGNLSEFDYKRFGITLGVGAGLGTAIGGLTGGAVGIRNSLNKKIVKKDGKQKKLSQQEIEKTEKALSAGSTKRMQQLVEDQLQITLRRKSEGLSGSDLKKARQDALNSFKNDFSEESKNMLGEDGIIALGLKPKDLSKHLDDVDNYFKLLDVEDITDVDSILKSFTKQKGLAAKGKYSNAHDIFVNTLSKKAVRDVYEAKLRPNNNTPLRILEERETKLLMLDKELATSSGRALNLRKQMYQGTYDDAFEDLNAQAAVLDVLNDIDNLAQKKQFIKSTDTLMKKVGNTAKITVDGAKELFIHNILGGTLTISANVFGSLAHVIDRTAMRYLGGVLGGSKIDRMKATNEFTDLFHNLKVATQESMRAINDSKNRIDNRWIRDDYAADEVIIGSKESPIYQKGKTPFANWYLDGTEKYGPAGGLMNVMGNAIRFVGRRGIIGTDEFVKQLSFRSYARSLATDKVIKDKKIDISKLNGKKLKELNIEIEKELQDAIDAQLFQASTGIDSGNNISRKAIEEARRGVFQDDPYQYQNKAIVGLDAAMWSSRGLQDLKRTKYENKAGNIIQGSNLLDFIVPFVRTPANLISYVVERTPGLQLASEKFGAKLAAGGADARQAHAALNTGIFMWSTAMMWGLSNLVEGKGSKDRGLAQVREETIGIPRHSILVGDKRINVRRLDPYARYVGVVGNMMDVYKYGSKQSTTEMFAAIALATAESFLDMPTLTGLKNLGDSLESENKIATYAGRQVSSLIPYYRLYNEILGDDRKYQQMNEFMDHIKRNAYGFFEDSIDLNRDPIFGKDRNYAADFPLPAFNYVDAEDLDDPLLAELKRLQFGIESPGFTEGSVNLKEFRGSDYGGTNKRSMYDEYQELVGKIKINGNTLEQQLRKDINSRYYKNIVDPRPGVDMRDKNYFISGRINKYRQAAKLAIYRKYEDFYKTEILPNKIKSKILFSEDENINTKDYIQKITN